MSMKTQKEIKEFLKVTKFLKDNGLLNFGDLKDKGIGFVLALNWVLKDSEYPVSDQTDRLREIIEREPSKKPSKKYVKEVVTPIPEPPIAVKSAVVGEAEASVALDGETRSTEIPGKVKGKVFDYLSMDKNKGARFTIQEIMIAIDFQKSSVWYALKSLENKGLIKIERKNGSILYYYPIKVKGVEAGY